MSLVFTPEFLTSLNLNQMMQIQSLLYPEKVSQFTVESQKLIRYMKDHDDYTEKMNLQLEEGITYLTI